jgi:hypothetical protein
MARQKLSDGEREQRRQADRERFQHAVAALLTSEGWQRWVEVRARNGLTRYSVGNQLLIAHQFPQATYVAGFGAFLKLGRCVRKGERHLRVFAPMTLTAAKSDPKPQAEEPERRKVFRTVAVFDISQTAPLPGTEAVPVTPPSQPVTGDTHSHLLAPLRELATELGYSTVHRPTGGAADGWRDYEQKELVVNSELSANGQVRVLIHEIAHALGIRSKEHGRSRAEVMVDTVTFIVCGSACLDVSGESVPYVAGWGGENAAQEIRNFAETIDATARRIEEKLAAPASSQPARLAA